MAHTKNTAAENGQAFAHAGCSHTLRGLNMSENVILRAEGICKSFYGNKVLDNVQIALKPGRVHALCGENGAGKSTLLKIITGL